MKINNLIDSHEDPFLEFYLLQKKRLLEGLWLSFDFNRIDPFSGIKRKNPTTIIGDFEADSGFYSFLNNSELFYFYNDNDFSTYLRSNIPRINIFNDEFYEIKIKSGDYQTKSFLIKAKDFPNNSFFHDDELIINLIKNKNIKVLLKLKDPGKSREIFEKVQLYKEETLTKYTETILENFLKRISTQSMERNPHNLQIIIEALNIEKLKNKKIEDQLVLIRSINLFDINILIYHLKQLRGRNNSLENILEKTKSKFELSKKEFKEMDYKLKAKVITIRDKY